MRSLRLIPTAFLLALLHPAFGAAGLSLMVPAYFGPDHADDWSRLTQAARRVPLVAIVNRNNGPGGPTADPGYLRVLAALRSVGGQATGYVYTSYGQRPIATVKADLQRWHDLYPLDGFFLDEMANDGSAASLDYYAALLDFCRHLNPKYRVTGNPGTTTTESYISRPTVDIVVTFENGTGYPAYTNPAWVKKYPPYRFCHLHHSIADVAVMRTYLDLAVTRNAGFVYVTDDVLDNPWDRLPTYWDDEVQRVEELNRAASGSQPPKLDLQRRDAGSARLLLEAPAGRYVLETSLTPAAWLPLTTNLTTTGELVFEPIFLDDPMRFFRARL